MKSFTPQYHSSGNSEIYFDHLLIGWYYCNKNLLVSIMITNYIIISI